MANKQTDPTEEEVANAQEVMRRAAEVQQRQAKEKMKPVLDITAMPEFAKVKKAIDELPGEFMTNMDVAPHIMAVRAGLNGLATVAPPASTEVATA